MTQICDPPIDSATRTGEQELAVAIATALSVPGKNAMLIGSDNERVGYAAVTEAVASGKPYALKISEVALRQLHARRA